MRSESSSRPVSFCNPGLASVLLNWAGFLGERPVTVPEGDMSAAPSRMRREEGIAVVYI